MDFNNDHKLSQYFIPVRYLKDKNFSYKLYLQLCTNMFWTQFKDNDIIRYEYKLNYINVADLCNKFEISRNTLNNKLSMNPYRLKNDEFGNKHLMFNTPIDNFVKLKLNTVEKLITLDEIDIRLFICIYSYSYDTIYGLTNLKLIEEIGYSSNSPNNEIKISKSLNKLIDLKYIGRNIKSNGVKKYSIFYKIL